VGAGLCGSSRRKLDTPETSRGRNEVRNVPWAGGADGRHVGSNERNDDGRLHQMPCRQQRAHRLPDLPFVARERKLISLAQAFYPEQS